MYGKIKISPFLFLSLSLSLALNVIIYTWHYLKGQAHIMIIEFSLTLYDKT